MGTPALYSLCVRMATIAWPRGSVKDVAESIGIPNLSDEVATALAADVEYRLREVMEESLKFMRHAKRTRVKVEDVDYALKAKNIEPLWGFASPHAPIAFRKTPHASGNLYWIEDDEIDLAKISQSALPPIPREISYTAHWLAVEGVQHAIPQNPSPTDLRIAAANARSTRIAAAGPEGTEVKPVVAHALSKELQLYFDRLTSATADANESVRIAALESFRGDTGLQGLVAYLVQWIAERVVTSLTSSLAALDQSLDILEALLQNTSLFVDPYLHQILPPVLSILLTSSLGPATVPAYAPSHISTREHAASFLAFLLSRYEHSYASLRPRVQQTILSGLLTGSSPDAKSSGTLVGALLGIKALGNDSVRKVFCARSPNLAKVGDALHRDTVSEQDREVCTNTVLDALQKSFSTATSDQSQYNYQGLEAVVGAYFANYISSRCSPSVVQGILNEPRRAAHDDAGDVAAQNGTHGDDDTNADGQDDDMAASGITSRDGSVEAEADGDDGGDDDDSEDADMEAVDE